MVFHACYRDIFTLISLRSDYAFLFILRSDFRVTSDEIAILYEHPYKSQQIPSKDVFTRIAEQLS
jgi:hypothetical protein